MTTPLGQFSDPLKLKTIFSAKSATDSGDKALSKPESKSSLEMPSSTNPFLSKKTLDLAMTFLTQQSHGDLSAKGVTSVFEGAQHLKVGPDKTLAEQKDAFLYASKVLHLNNPDDLVAVMNKDGQEETLSKKDLLESTTQVAPKMAQIPTETFSDALKVAKEFLKGQEVTYENLKSSGFFEQLPNLPNGGNAAKLKELKNAREVFSGSWNLQNPNTFASVAQQSGKLDALSLEDAKSAKLVTGPELYSDTKLSKGLPQGFQFAKPDPDKPNAFGVFMALASEEEASRDTNAYNPVGPYYGAYQATTGTSSEGMRLTGYDPASKDMNKASKAIIGMLLQSPQAFSSPANKTAFFTAMNKAQEAYNQGNNAQAGKIIVEAGKLVREVFLGSTHHLNAKPESKSIVNNPNSLKGSEFSQLPMITIE